MSSSSSTRPVRVFSLPLPLCLYLYAYATGGVLTRRRVRTLPGPGADLREARGPPPECPEPPHRQVRRHRQRRQARPRGCCPSTGALGHPFIIRILFLVCMEICRLKKERKTDARRTGLPDDPLLAQGREAVSHRL